MIGFLRGRVAQLSPEICLLDVGGVGYRVYITASAHRRLRPGEEALLYTHLSVREDDMTLYGFATQEEQQSFQLLLSVSGIGPKVALGVLSAITAERLFQAIRGQRLAELTKLPGIGKKSAQRLVLELKDKVAAADGAGDDALAGDDAPPADSGAPSEAEAALSALGYTAAEIAAVLRRVPGPMTAEETIRFALKEFVGRS